MPIEKIQSKSNKKRRHRNKRANNEYSQEAMAILRNEVNKAQIKRRLYGNPRGE